jgi:hypothetical protein
LKRELKSIKNIIKLNSMPKKFREYPGPPIGSKPKPNMRALKGSNKSRRKLKNNYKWEEDSY